MTPEEQWTVNALQGKEPLLSSVRDCPGCGAEVRAGCVFVPHDAQGCAPLLRCPECGHLWFILALGGFGDA